MNTLAVDYYQLLEQKGTQTSEVENVLKGLKFEHDMDWLHDLPLLASALMRIQCPSKPYTSLGPSSISFADNILEIKPYTVTNYSEDEGQGRNILAFEDFGTSSAEEPWDYSGDSALHLLEESTALDHTIWDMPPDLSQETSAWVDVSNCSIDSIVAIDVTYDQRLQEQDHHAKGCDISQTLFDGAVFGTVQQEEHCPERWPMTMDIGLDSTDIFDDAGDLPPMIDSWFPTLPMPLTSTLSEFDLGVEKILRFPLPAMEPLIPEVVDIISAGLAGTLNSQPDQAPAISSYMFLLQCEPSANASVLLERSCEAAWNEADYVAGVDDIDILASSTFWMDAPDAIDWLGPWSLQKIDTFQIGAASLPTVFDIERVPEMQKQLARPSIVRCGTPKPPALGTGAALTLAQKFLRGCWHLGFEELEASHLPVTEPVARNPLATDAPCLLMDQVTKPGMAFVGYALRSQISRHAGQSKQHQQNLQLHLQQLCGADKLMPFSHSSQDPCCSRYLEITEHQEDIWPISNSKMQNVNLAAFKKIGPLAGQPEIQSTSTVDSSLMCLGPRSMTIDRNSPKPQSRCSDHLFPASPHIHECLEQIHGDAHVVWATFCSYANTGEASSIPDSSGIQSLMQQYAENYLRDKDLHDQAQHHLELYRILMSLQVLIVLRDELSAHGALQAAFCANAILARCPHFVLRGNTWTHQALLKLHSLILEHSAMNSSTGASSLCCEMPARLCQYAHCRGCRVDGAAFESQRCHELVRLTELAAAQGRKLAVLFASQQLLSVVQCTLGSKMQTIALGALSSAQYCMQRLATSGVALIHENALAPHATTATTTPSPDTLVSMWEMRRILRQHCMVVAYQPLTLPVATAAVDINLTLCKTSGVKDIHNAVSKCTLLPQNQVQQAYVAATAKSTLSVDKMTLVMGTHMLHHQEFVCRLEAIGISISERDFLASSSPDFIIAPRICGFLRSTSALASTSGLKGFKDQLHQALISFAEVVLFVIICEDLDDMEENDTNLYSAADWVQGLHASCLPDGKSIRILYTDASGLPDQLHEELLLHSGGCLESKHQKCSTPAEKAQEMFLAAMPGLNCVLASMILSTVLLGELCIMDSATMCRMVPIMCEEAVELLQAGLWVSCPARETQQVKQIPIMPLPDSVTAANMRQNSNSALLGEQVEKHFSASDAHRALSEQFQRPFGASDAQQPKSVESNHDSTDARFQDDTGNRDKYVDLLYSCGQLKLAAPERIELQACHTKQDRNMDDNTGTPRTSWISSTGKNNAAQASLGSKDSESLAASNHKLSRSGLQHFPKSCKEMKEEIFQLTPKRKRVEWEMHDDNDFIRDQGWHGQAVQQHAIEEPASTSSKSGEPKQCTPDPLWPTPYNQQSFIPQDNSREAVDQFRTRAGKRPCARISMFHTLRRDKPKSLKVVPAVGWQSNKFGRTGRRH